MILNPAGKNKYASVVLQRLRLLEWSKEQEAGMPTAEVCLRHGLVPAWFDKFKAKYGGMNISETHHCKSP